MNIHFSDKSIIPCLIVILFIMACSSGAAATPTPIPPTNTPTLTSTSTPKPTATLRPTATEVPPTPTPAPMGTAVSTTDYEVNVISMRTLNTVYLDNLYQWVPTKGNMFVELGIKVVNLKPGSKVNVSWGNVYVREEDGNQWYPNWGEFKPVASDVEISPKSLSFRSLENPDEPITFDDVAYIRAIWGVGKHSPTTLLFGFGDSPLIEITVP